MLHSNLAFHNVDANRIVLIDGNCDRRGLVCATDNGSGCEYTLLGLAGSRLQVNAHPARDNIQQVARHGSVLPKYYARIAEQLKAAAAGYLEAGVAI
jgi:hypothetical protein